MAFLRGDGTENSHLVVDDWDSFYNALRTASSTGQTDNVKLAYYYDSNTDKYYYRLNGDVLPEGADWSFKGWGSVEYIELDPDKENKVIDCNNFAIGEHHITDNGMRPLPIGNNCSTITHGSYKYIYGNNWILKNFWYYGTYFFNTTNTFTSEIIVNNLHFLNCFHLANDNTADDSLFYCPDSHIIFNDCKISILSTGGRTYQIAKIVSNTNRYIRMNRCSLNIINTSKEFNFFDSSSSGGSTYYYPYIFYNCNFRIKSLNSGNFLGCRNFGAGTKPKFYFCKFTCFFDKFSISDMQDSNNGGYRIGGYTSGSSSSDTASKGMLTNCLLQIKYNNLYHNIEGDRNSYINDSTLGVVNIDYIDENKYRIMEDDKYPNYLTIGMSKNDILNLNKITEKGFPVMSKIIPDENEV